VTNQSRGIQGRAPKKMFFVFPVKHGMKAVRFVRKQRVVEDRNHNCRRQFTIFLPFRKRQRKQPRPIIQHPFWHIMLMDDLDFNVDPLAKVRKHKHIQPAHLAIFRLFRKFGVFMLHINNTLAAGTVQLSVQKRHRDSLSAWVAEQLLKHKIHFQIEVFFWHWGPSFRGIF